MKLALSALLACLTELPNSTDWPQWKSHPDDTYVLAAALFHDEALTEPRGPDIDLSSWRVDDKALKGLAPTHTHITSLSLANAKHITDQGFRHLKSLDQLERLDISEMQLMRSSLSS